MLALVTTSVVLCLLVLLVLWRGPQETNSAAEPAGRSNQSGGADVVDAPVGVTASVGANHRRPVASSGPNLFVSVVSNDAVPVRGAEVVRWDGDSTEALGLTGASGRLAGTIPERAGQTLSVAADGFAVAYLDVGTSRPVEVTITLESQVTIEGRVVNATGDPLPGMPVLAWPVDRPPSAREIVEHLTAVPLFPQAVTNASGSFRIVGLRPTATYEVVSGGSGYVQRAPFARVKLLDGPQTMELKLDRLYGTRLRVHALGGGRPVPDSRLGVPDCSFRRTLKGTQSVDWRNPSAILSRSILELHLEQFERSLYDIVILHAAGDVERERLGPVEYRCCVPGYAPGEGEFWTWPVVGEELVDHSVTIEQTVPSFGPLEIRVSGLPADHRPLHTSDDRMLYLFGRNLDADCSYSLALSATGPAGPLGLVPTGRTEFKLASTDWEYVDWTHPFAEIDVGLEEDRLTLDLSHFGGVDVALKRKDGTLATGPAEFRLHAKQAILRHVSFHRAPYRIYGLTQGTYSLTVHRAYGAHDHHAHTPVFEVSPGSVVATTCLPVDGEEACHSLFR